MHSSRQLHFALLASLGLTAAAAAPVAHPAWPPPPAEPYVVHVRDIAGPRDIGVRPPALTRLANWLTGETATKLDLDKPFGLALDAAGNLLIVDTGANAVCYLDFARKKWLRWTAAGDTRFVAPVAAVRAGATIFVADAALGRVFALDERGKFLFAITNGLERPAGLALAGDRLIVADAQRHEVLTFNLRGELQSRFGQRGKAAGEFNFPTHVATDAAGRIYVTDSLNHRIQVFAADGKFLRAFGGAGDGPGYFSRPKGVALDAAGHVYVVDAVFGNVQIFDEAGRLLLAVGEEGAGAGQFSLPNGIAINARNEIFVADAYNHRIQVLRYTGRQ